MLVSFPSVLVGFYLQRVEERMLAEARIREEIEERTGISTRGYLIPQREIRENVQGMLSSGNQPKIAGKQGGGEMVRTVCILGR